MHESFQIVGCTFLAGVAFVGMCFFMKECETTRDRNAVQRYCVERGNPAADCAKLGTEKK